MCEGALFLYEYILDVWVGWVCHTSYYVNFSVVCFSHFVCMFESHTFPITNLREELAQLNVL